MHELANFDFVVGIAAGKILFGALLVSVLFRNVALAVAAVAICVVYFERKVPGLVDLARTVMADFNSRPSFAKGAILGAVLALVVFGMYRQRRA